MHHIKKDAIFVVDGSYLLYRSFFAIRPLYNSAGTPTQATFGFCRAIKKIIDTYHPEHLVIVWDSKVKTFRHEQYPAYKATRQKPPNELFVQKEDILRFIDAVKITQIFVDGYEGDDVIAAVAHKFTTHQIILVAADKDMNQLLSERVLILDPFNDRIVDPELFEKEHGFTPAKVPFYYAILGDTSDNIPGVHGIGKKGAQDLAQQFNSLDDLYQQLDQVSKERTRTLLAEQKENAYLSLSLFLLRAPAIDLTLKQLVYNPENWVLAEPIFKELELTSLLKDLYRKFPAKAPDSPMGPIFALAEETGTKPTPRKQRKAKPGDQHTLSLFGDGDVARVIPEQAQGADEPSPEPNLTLRPWNLVIIQDEPALNELIKLIKQADWVGLDTETTGGLPLQDDLVGISFAVNHDTGYYIPLGHTTGTQIDRAVALATLKPVLESHKIRYVMHNAKFDQLVLQRAGINMSPVAFDTILGANLLRNDDWQRINLKALSAGYLHEPMRKFKDVLGKKYKTFAEVPLEEGSLYAAHDALQTLKLQPIVAEKLAAIPTLEKYFNSIEMPFYTVLRHMETAGICLDPEKITATAVAVGTAIDTIEAKIRAAIEDKGDYRELNLNAPRQIEKLLFDDLKLPAGKKSETGHRSTDQEVLEDLAKIHPIPGLILHYRELTKLKNTYIQPLPTFINPETHRIHTNYSQTLVATGRLSSSDPNLQNIPTGEGFGMQIREAFFAPPGKIFLSADYAQVELRILAHLSGDPTLINVFLHNHDIHAETAAQLFDVPLNDVSHEQRQLGKRINFSIIYGVTPFGLARDLGIKQSDAKTYIEKYMARFTGVATWMAKTVEHAVTNGYVETWLGRRRHIPELKERNKSLFEAGKRVAINTPVQGTQAEIIKLAMINLDRIFTENKLTARMILQIHDELVIELPQEELSIVEPMVKAVMGSIVSWQVPLAVTTRSGTTWAAITK